MEIIKTEKDNYLTRYTIVSNGNLITTIVDTSKGEIVDTSYNNRFASSVDRYIANMRLERFLESKNII